MAPRTKDQLEIVNEAWSVGQSPLRQGESPLPPIKDMKFLVPKQQPRIAVAGAIDESKRPQFRKNQKFDRQHEQAEYLYGKSRVGITALNSSGITDVPFPSGGAQLPRKLKPLEPAAAFIYKKS